MTLGPLARSIKPVPPGGLRNPLATMVVITILSSYTGILFEGSLGVKVMKEKIHPKYFDAVISCACGEKHETRSTMKAIHVDICSACHPFYTGKQKLVDTAGRVYRYKKRYGTA